MAKLVQEASPLDRSGIHHAQAVHDTDFPLRLTGMDQLAAVASDIAHAFVSARRNGRSLPDYPGRVPADMAQAYAIQNAAIGIAGDEIMGWKVGRIGPPHETAVGVNRLIGPVFTIYRSAAGHDRPPVGIFPGGFSAVEAEFLVRLRHDIRGGTAGDLASVADAIAAVHVGLEIASSPFAGINDLGPAVTASDFGNNNGIVIGAEIPDWRSQAIDRWDVRTAVDGETVGEGRAAGLPDGMLGSVAFLLQALAERGRSAAGCWIATGAVTGVHAVTPGAVVSASFADRYHVSCAIAREPSG